MLSTHCDPTRWLQCWCECSGHLQALSAPAHLYRASRLAPSRGILASPWAVADRASCRGLARCQRMVALLGGGGICVVSLGRRIPAIVGRNARASSASSAHRVELFCDAQGVPPGCQRLTVAVRTRWEFWSILSDGERMQGSGAMFHSVVVCLLDAEDSFVGWLAFRKKTRRVAWSIAFGTGRRPEGVHCGPAGAAFPTLCVSFCCANQESNWTLDFGMLGRLWGTLGVPSGVVCQAECLPGIACSAPRHFHAPLRTYGCCEHRFWDPKVSPSGPRRKHTEGQRLTFTLCSSYERRVVFYGLVGTRPVHGAVPAACRQTDNGSGNAGNCYGVVFVRSDVARFECEGVFRQCWFGSSRKDGNSNWMPWDRNWMAHCLWLKALKAPQRWQH